MTSVKCLEKHSSKSKYQEHEVGIQIIGIEIGTARHENVLAVVTEVKYNLFKLCK